MLMFSIPKCERCPGCNAPVQYPTFCMTCRREQTEAWEQKQKIKELEARIKDLEGKRDTPTD